MRQLPHILTRPQKRHLSRHLRPHHQGAFRSGGTGRPAVRPGGGGRGRQSRQTIPVHPGRTPESDARGTGGLRQCGGLHFRRPAGAGNNKHSNQIAATLTERQRFCWLEGKQWAKMGEKPGKVQAGWWDSAQIVQRSGRRVGRAVIHRRWIPGERVLISSILKFRSLKEAKKTQQATD